MTITNTCRHCGVQNTFNPRGGPDANANLIREIFSNQPSPVHVSMCECPTCDLDAMEADGFGACEWCLLTNPMSVIPGAHGDGSDMEVEPACYLRMQN